MMGFFDKLSRAFPTGNALLYISLLSMDFQSASYAGRTLFVLGEKIKK